VHHDIWDYDAVSPVVLFDTVINGQPRKGIAEAGKTGWVYILDRTNGKPLIGIEERPVPQEPKQKTAKTGAVLWKFQTGFGADAPAIVYEVDGDEYIAIATGGNSLQGSAYGDAVWAFSLKGQLSPLWPPPPPSTVAGPAGPIAEGVAKINTRLQQPGIQLLSRPHPD